MIIFETSSVAFFIFKFLFLPRFFYSSGGVLNRVIAARPHLFINKSYPAGYNQAVIEIRKIPFRWKQLRLRSPSEVFHLHFHNMFQAFP